MSSDDSDATTITAPLEDGEITATEEREFIPLTTKGTRRVRRYDAPMYERLDDRPRLKRRKDIAGCYIRYYKLTEQALAPTRVMDDDFDDAFDVLESNSRT